MQAKFDLYHPRAWYTALPDHEINRCGKGGVRCSIPCVDCRHEGTPVHFDRARIGVVGWLQIQHVEGREQQRLIAKAGGENTSLLANEGKAE